jgi:hypothetical protein
MGTLLDEQNFGNECGNVSIMGCILQVLSWMDRILAMNVAMQIFLCVFYGYSFG